MMRPRDAAYPTFSAYATSCGMDVTAIIVPDITSLGELQHIEVRFI